MTPNNKNNKCGLCGKINPTFDAKVHSITKEPLFCNSICAEEYYLN